MNGWENSPFDPTYRYITVDVETTGLDWTTCQLHGVSVSYDAGETVYYPAWDIPDHVRETLANPQIAKIGQNFHGYDGKVLRRAGFTIEGPIDDVMIIWNLIDDRSPLGLKYLSEKHLGSESLERKRRLDRYISEHKAGNIAGLCAQDLLDPMHPHLAVIGDYCCEDGDNTRRLLQLGIEKLRAMDRKLKEEIGLPKSPFDYYHEEARPLESVLLDMEYRGIRVNLAAVEKIRAEAEGILLACVARMTPVMRKRIEAVEEILHRVAGAKPGLSEKQKAKLQRGVGKLKFRWSNPNHVGRLLYEACGLPEELVSRTEKGSYQTDKNTLLELRNVLLTPELAPRFSRLAAVLKDFAEFKKQEKIVSTYTGDSKKGILSKVRVGADGVPRIYPKYRQTTGTGRLACSNPNMQNLKRESLVKTFFVPDDPETEVIDDADYSQIELRTASHRAGDGPLRQAYVRGEDVHLRSASLLFGRKITKADDVERQAGKRTNFLAIFKGRKHRLQQALLADTGKEFSLEDCDNFLKVWFEAYPEVAAYLDTQLEFFLKHKITWSETGHIRRIPDIALGADIDWRYTTGGRSYPAFVGSAARRASIVTSILKKNPKLRAAQVTERMVGQEARLRYAHAEKVGYNEPIQGLAASMTKRSMIALHAAGRRILNQVHDSLAVSRKQGDDSATQHLVDTMISTYPLALPVCVDVKSLKSFHPRDKA